jgi:N-acetylneuraminic acid mutarotase
MLGSRLARLAWAGLVGQAKAWAGVLAVVLAVAALAAPGIASAASVRPAAAAGGAGSGHARLAGSIATTPAGSAPVKRACPAPANPGQAACQALVRVDAAGHQGVLAAGAMPLGYGPADLQDAYDLPSATAGRGATVAIVDAYDDPTAAADLAVYRNQYGLPPCTVADGCFRKVDQRGGTDYPPRDGGWAEEISLDLDMVSAICPNCHIMLVEADSDSLADLAAADNEAVALGAGYVSDSWAGCEYPGDTAYDQDFNHPGVVIATASGDYGYDNYEQYCATPSYPAASPYVVSVGGTSLVRDPATPRGWLETAWSDTGSGCSLEPKPAWQKDTGCHNRTEVDVSAVADPDTGVAVYDSYQVGGWAEFGGTSVATPLIAATYALAGRPAGGSYPASYLYAHRSALNHVTSGSNSPTGCAPYKYLCTAGPGYNGPAGLGTPEGVAAFQAGPHGTITGTVISTTGAPVAGAEVRIGGAATVSDADGRYTTTALAGSYAASASEYGYAAETVPHVTITSGATITENFTLRKLPAATVTGTVSDASGHGWGLYAEIRVPGTPVVAYTSPVTGRYRLSLPVTGQPYRLETSALYPGYLASTSTITPTAAGLRQNIGLSVDLQTCDAPGYRIADHGYTQDFNGTTAPPGWATSGGSGSWVFNNPDHLPNNTGGSGGFALLNVPGNPDGGSYSLYSLYSPVINLTRDPTPVLQFDQYLNDTTDASADVYLSLDGGKTWSSKPVYSRYLYGIFGHNTQVISLPEAAGQSRVEVEFAADFNQDVWEIDNFFLGEHCQPVSGGLVVGQVRDANTGAPVNGATVADGSQSVTTMPEPGDPAVGGGLYMLFTGSSGTQTVTASAPSYSPGTAQVTVTGGSTVRADINLPAGRLAVSPGTVAVTAPMGGKTTARLTVTNTGTAPASLQLNAQQGPFTLAGPLAGQTPLRTARGHYTPALPAASQRRRPALAAAPAPGHWTQIAHYPDYIFDNAAATDPATGDVYSVGGTTSDFEAGTEAFVYRPASGTWAQLPDMQFSRDDAAVASVINGKLYVTDGYDAVDGVNQPALEIYDPATGLWSTGAPIPQASYGPTAAVLDGKMYVVGGCVEDGVCTSTDVQVYDPATNTWSQAAHYPLEISFLACGAIDGKLYCAGGYDHKAQQGTAAAYVYDPAANHWTAIASLPINLWGGGYAAANGQLLVSGGITGSDSTLTNQGFAYNPAANTWTPLPNSPSLVYRGGSACGFYRIGGMDAAGNIYATAEQLPGYGECDGGAGVPWLTVSPARATLAPGHSITVTLTLNAADPSVTQPGSYTATLYAGGNTPYLPPTAGVTLTAAPPSTWGKLAGTVRGQACTGAAAPLPGATVQVTSHAGGWTLTADRDGGYGIWLERADNPVTLIVTQPGWLGQTKTARVVAVHTTTVNVTLRQAGCG